MIVGFLVLFAAGAAWALVETVGGALGLGITPVLIAIAGWIVLSMGAAFLTAALRGRGRHHAADRIELALISQNGLLRLAEELIERARAEQRRPSPRAIYELETAKRCRKCGERRTGSILACLKCHSKEVAHPTWSDQRAIDMARSM